MAVMDRRYMERNEAYASNDLPQPQVCLAFGFVMRKPAPERPSL
jgi:hypothetical protein